MVNALTATKWAYADTKKWDADRNTAEFIEMMPVWRTHGLLVITLNLQGGSPEGYSKDQPWYNSAINSDGTLDQKYMARMEKVIDKADDLGMVVILGLSYFGQDERVKDEQAVIAGVDAAVDWLIAVLPVTTFWTFVREFPRERLNWGPVRTVSRGQAPQADVCSAEIAILLQFAQRRTQLSPGKRGI